MIVQHRFKASAEKPEIQVIKDYGILPPVLSRAAESSVYEYSCECH